MSTPPVSSTTTPTTTETTPPNPSLFSRIGSGIVNTLFAPVSWTAGAAVGGATNRLSQALQNNEGEIATRVQQTINQALLRRAPDPFYALPGCIQSFLTTPTSANLATLRTQLSLVQPEANAAIYAPVASERQDRVRQLTLALDVNFPTTNPPLVDGMTDQYAPLTPTELTRQHLQEVQAILSETLMQYNGSLVSTLDLLSGFFLNENDGLIQTVLQRVRQNISGQGGLVEELRNGIVTQDDSVLSQATRMLRAELSSVPHDAVRQTRIAMLLYHQALSIGASRETLVPLFRRIVETLEILERDQAEIFATRALITPEQWQALQQFRERISSYLPDEAVISTQAELQQQLAQPRQIIEQAMAGQTGLITELNQAGDHLADRVQQVISQLETLPNRMISGAFSPSPAPANVATAPPTTETPPAATEPADTESIPYSTLMDRSSSLLSQIMGSAGQAISLRAAGSLATMMSFLFSKVITHLEQRGESQHIIDTIDRLRTQVNEARENGSWDQLIATLQRCKEVMQQQEAYLQGFRLPLSSVRAGNSAIPSFLQNIAGHDAALQLPGSELHDTVTPAMIEHEALKLQKRASTYAPIKLINEYILGLAPDDAAYAAMIEISPNTPIDGCEEEFKTRFFQRIDASDRFLLTKWIAKAAYYVAVPISSFFTNALISNSVEAFKQWKSSPEDRLNPKDIQVIGQTRNWLAILSASYNQAAYTPPEQTRDFQVMLEQAIQAPERNGGLTSTELYSAFSRVAFDTFGPRFNWRKEITQYYDVEIPATSSFYVLNPVLIALNTFCSWTMNALLFVPEWIANTVMSIGTSLFLKNNTYLQTKVNRIVDSIKSNTPTSYALNKVLYRQLQRVWESIQASTADTAIEGGLQTQQSTSKKLEISRMVEYLFEVLNKSRFGTQDRLRAFLEGRLPARARAELEIDELFFPEALEIAVDLISTSFEAVMTEESMDELFFDILSIANGSFDASEPVSDEEFAGIEKGIRDLSDQILESSIFYALGEKFDFTGNKQRAGVHQFTEDLKTQSRETIAGLRQAIDQVQPQGPITPQTELLLRTSIQNSVAFQRGRMDALSRADGNRNFHTETKLKLNELSQALVVHCTQIGPVLNQSLQNYEQSVKFDQGIRHLNQMQDCLNQIETTICLQGVQTRQILNGKAQFETLLQTLTSHRSLSALFPNQEQYDIDKMQIEAAIALAERSRRELDTFTQAIHLFQRVKTAKQDILDISTTSAELRENERILVNLIQTLPSSYPHRQLLDQILALMHATTLDELEESSRQYHHNMMNLMMGPIQSLQTAQQQIRTAKQQFTEKMAHARITATESIDQNRQSLQVLLDQIRAHLEAFDRWVGEVHDIPFWNFFIFDMQWVTEITKDIAFSRAKLRVQELINALYQRHTTIGIANNLFFRPFLQKYGPQYLSF